MYLLASKFRFLEFRLLLCRVAPYVRYHELLDQDVSNALDSERMKQIRQNRELFTSTVETIKLCRAQNTPICGQRDDGKLNNQGSNVGTAEKMVISVTYFGIVFRGAIRCFKGL